MRAGLFLCLPCASYPSGDAWRKAIDLVQALANEHGRDAFVLETALKIAEAEIEGSRRSGRELLKAALKPHQNTRSVRVARTLKNEVRDSRSRKAPLAAHT
jgi:hypothetical protein